MSRELENIESILYEALKRIDAEERKAYLEATCGINTQLRADIDSLLQAYEDEAGILKAPADLLEEPISTLTEGPGTVIGRYKLLEKIGEGGMASVYMAEQEKPIHRKVALKIIKLGMDTRQVITRFEVERQALAMMDHPNIAKVLDAGTTETGRPYFVMELVTGVSITEFCDKNRLSTRQRLDLFIQVCNAVQHAHQKGVIHRDIKPTNVMVTLHDGKPVPKVIDFGIAKATAQRLTEKTFFTRYAHMIGTPAYMSPEQAEMSGLDVDTRTDIYSLGVLLYELLTGTTPFDAEELREAGYVEMQRIICEEEPTKPSTKLSAMGEVLTDIAKHRKTNPNLLPKLVRGDLDWIVMKSLEKDRTRRYDTAAELAVDIGRHLNSEPVHAAAPSFSYKLHKFIRRHRVGVMGGLLIAFLVLMALFTLSMSTAMIWREKGRTQEALEREQYAVRNAKNAQAQEAEARKTAQSQQKEAVRQRNAAYHNLYVAQMRLGQQYWEAGQIITLNEMLRNYLPKTGQVDLRGWEWYYLLSLCHKDLLTLRGQSSSLTWSPDGRRLATASQDRTVMVWEPNTGEKLLVLRGHTGELSSVAWSPDGRFIASGSQDKTAKVWDAATGQELLTLRGHTGGVNPIAWSPDSRHLASVGSDRTIKVWYVETGKEQLTFHKHTSVVYTVAWSPDGRRLASGDGSGLLKIWEAHTGREILTLPALNHDLYTVAWSPDGTRLATGGYDHPLKVLDATTGQEILSIQHDSGVESVAWSPDGKQLASATRSQRIRIWDANTGQELSTLRGHMGWVISVAWSPDSRRLASASSDHTVKIWDAHADQRALILDHAKAISVSVAWNPKDDLLVSVGGGKIKIWDPKIGSEVLSWQADDAGLVAWSPDGRRLVTGLWGHGHRTVRVWDAGTGEEIVTAPIGSCPTWSPDGQHLAIASGKTVIVWDISTKQTTLSLRGHADRVWVVSWSPDGCQLASSAWDGWVIVWDAVTGSRLLTLRGHAPGKWIGSITWSPDGKRLATGGWDQTVKVWDTGNGREVLSLRGHTGAIFSVAWSPDGRRIVSASMDGTAKVWDATTGQELLTLRGHNDRVSSIAWSSDGKCLATASSDGTVRVWDASKGYEVLSGLTYRHDQAHRYYNQGSELARKRQFQDACYAFGKALEMDPNFIAAYYERSQIYWRLQQYDKALFNLYKCIELEPNSPAFSNGVAWILAACPNPKFRDPAQAVEHAKRAVELAPDKGFYRRTLGVAYYRAGQWEEAIKQLTKATEVRGGEHSKNFFLAMAHWQLGNKDQARKWYEQAIKWLQKYNPNHIQLCPFRLEAAELLGVSEQTMPNEKDVVPENNH